MRLNAFLGRAGVASRRKADELIVAGRVTVNGEPGQLNTFVSARRRRRGGRPTGDEAAARVRAAPQARRRRDDSTRSGRPADGRRPRRSRGPRRAGRPPRRRHDRRAAAHERRPARAPARASALRGGQGLRGGGRRLAVGRDVCGSWPKASSWRTAVQRSRRGPPPRPLAHRADAPRGTQAPGEADVRGGRPPGRDACTARRYATLDARRPRAGRVAGADSRTRCRRCGSSAPDEAHDLVHAVRASAPTLPPPCPHRARAGAEARRRLPAARGSAPGSARAARRPPRPRLP